MADTFQAQTPFNWQVPLVNPQTGAPTDQFIRLWQTAFQNASATNSSVVDKVGKSRKINTSGGLQGGGDLSADRTLSLTDTGVTANTYGSRTTVPQFTVDAKGRISSVTEVTISGGGGGRGPVTLGTLRPLSDFTTVNFSGSTTATENAGRAITLKDTNPTGSSTITRGLKIAAPTSTPYLVAIYVQPNTPAFRYHGIAWGYIDSSNKLELCSTVSRSDSGLGDFEYTKWSSPSARASVSSLGLVAPGHPSVGFWVGVRNDGSNLTWYVSGDGGIFYPLKVVALGSKYVSTVDTIYIGISDLAYAFSGSSYPISFSMLAYDENGLSRLPGG